MKYLLSLSLPLMLLIVNCSENETGPTTYTDAELKEKLVGSWSADYVKINFNADGSYTEYYDIGYTIGDSTVHQIEDMKGTYVIENGILIKNITEWKIISNSYYGGGYQIPATKIIFRKNLLYQYYLNILSRIGNDSDSLWGEWHTFDWAHHYSDPDRFGRVEQTYNFKKDSMLVTRGNHYPFDSSAAFNYYTYPLIYNPPEIRWGNDIPRVIELHSSGSQMYMFYKPDRLPPPLTKQK